MQQVSPMATRYDGPTIWFHWAVACLVLVQWLLAQVIDWFPLGVPRIEARSVHISLGLFLGVLLLARLVWRATRGRVLPPAEYAAEQQLSWLKCFQPFDRHKTSPRPRLKRWFRMPITPHIEKHFLASALVRDIVIGMADGLTVPFALAAGLSGAVSSTSIIITAGLAEVAAGGLAMGLGGYLAARTDLDHYHSERQREKAEIKQVPETERAEVRQILRDLGLDPILTATVANELTRDPERWISF